MILGMRIFAQGCKTKVTIQRVKINIGIKCSFLQRRDFEDSAQLFRVHFMIKGGKTYA